MPRHHAMALSGDTYSHVLVAHIADPWDSAHPDFGISPKTAVNLSIFTAQP